MSDEQLFGTSIAEIIKKRISVRTYLAQPLTPEIQEKLRGFFSILRSPFGGNVRFNLIESDLARKESNAKLSIRKIAKDIKRALMTVNSLKLRLFLVIRNLGFIQQLG